MPDQSTTDEHRDAVPIEMYEAFSASDACVNGFDFYGVRKIRIFQRERVEVDCGYLRPGNVPDGEFSVSAPCRDSHGRAFVMRVTFPDTTRWRVVLRGGEYKTGWDFTYVGQVNPEGTGYIELEHPGEPLRRLPINL